MHDFLTRLLYFGLTGADGATADADRLTEITGILSDAEALAVLTDDEVTGLETELRELADRILDGTAAGIERNDTVSLTVIADSLDAIRGEAATRIENAEARQAEVDAVMARIRAEAEGDDTEGEAEETTTDEVEEPEEVEEVEEPAEAEEALEPVLASAAAPTLPTLADLAARVPSRRQPAPARTDHPFIRAVERNENVTMDDFAALMVERWSDFRGTAPGEGEVRYRLGRLSILDRIPEERMLRAGDSAFTNDAKMNAVTSGVLRPEAWTDEIVASGGFCAPFPAEYDLIQLSGTQRPVRDSLARFGADRGGIRFTPPPDMSEVLVSQAGGAIGIWTNTTDTTPGEAVKSCQTVNCGTPTDAETQAIYNCLGFGNFGARAYPEWVRTWTENAAAMWARIAERELLDAISAASTPITGSGIYGFVPELLTHILQLSVGERNRQRMDTSARLRVMLPSWVIAQMQIDYLRQGNVVTVLKTEQDIRSMFAAANVNVTFYEDERTGAGQIVLSQAANVDIRDLPDTVEWYLTHEGAFSFLDGGTLDLGLVRDSTLNETNDFRIFTESWEGVAFRGVFAYRVRDVLCPSGDRQIPVDLDPCGAS